MRRALLLLLIASLVTVSAFGEGQKEGTSAEDETVTIHMSVLEADPAGQMEAARQRFNEQHDDVQVEFVPGSNNASEMHDQVVTQLTGQSENLDIVNMDVIWVAEFAQAGWLHPLGDLFTPDIQDNYVQRQVDAMRYNGEIWAVPWFNDLHPMWYRSDLLEEHGFEPPQTYERAVEIAQTIQEEEDVQGFTMHWGRSEQLMVSFTEFVHANGGRIINDDGEFVLDSQENIEALQFMYDMIYEYGVVSESALGNSVPDDSRVPFTQGNALFNPNWGYVWGINQAEDSPVRNQTWLTSNLAFEGGRRASGVGGWNFAIADHSEHKEEAWEVIRWFTTFENQKTMMLNGGFQGTHLDLYSDEEVLEANPHLEEYLSAFEGASNRPRHPQYSRISDTIQNYVHRALSGQISPEEALQQANEELENLE